MAERFDAVVVGAGPNGLAAAITLAQAGRSVCLYEANETVGGAARSGALTLPGFVHDLCSAAHPMARAMPFIEGLPLADHGLTWIEPPVAVAHPFDDGSAAAMYPSLDETAEGLGADADAWRTLFGPMVAEWERWLAFLPRPVQSGFAAPFFGLHVARRTLPGAVSLARSRFDTHAARALFLGVAAHSFLPLEQAASSSVGTTLTAAGHRVGWPLPRGGTGKLTEAMARYLESLGGEVITGHPVDDLKALPQAKDVFLDLTPRQVLTLADTELDGRVRRRFAGWRYGPAAFKLDYALSGPVPWTAGVCHEAGTVHLGGSPGELVEAEAAPWDGRVGQTPFVLTTQPSRFDESRAPEGHHTLWAYAHVPWGFEGDAADLIEAQIERFAPGFRNLVLDRHVTTPRMFEAGNANLVGGDIAGGTPDLGQLVFRPFLKDPYRLGEGLWMCSSSTPPGPGVHGMCGHLAAQAALEG